MDLVGSTRATGVVLPPEVGFQPASNVSCVRTILARWLSETASLLNSVSPFRWSGHDVVLSSLSDILAAEVVPLSLNLMDLSNRIELVAPRVANAVARSLGQGERAFVMPAFPANQIEAAERRFHDLARSHELMACRLRLLLADPQVRPFDRFDDLIEGMTALHERAAWSLRRSLACVRSNGSSRSGRLRAASIA